MSPSIYNQLNRALGQAAKYGQRSILYRGKMLECVVLLGSESTQLEWGGLQNKTSVHILVQRSLIDPLIGQDGDPHTNETVTYPAVLTAGISPQDYRIDEVVGQEWDWAFSLTDPSK